MQKRCKKVKGVGEGVDAGIGKGADAGIGEGAVAAAGEGLCQVQVHNAECRMQNTGGRNKQTYTQTLQIIDSTGQETG